MTQLPGNQWLRTLKLRKIHWIARLILWPTASSSATLMWKRSDFLRSHDTASTRVSFTWMTTLIAIELVGSNLYQIIKLYPPRLLVHPTHHLTSSASRSYNGASTSLLQGSIRREQSTGFSSLTQAQLSLKEEAEIPYTSSASLWELSTERSWKHVHQQGFQVLLTRGHIFKSVPVHGKHSWWTPWP